jgi:hypothetical protein
MDQCLVGAVIQDHLHLVYLNLYKHITCNCISTYSSIANLHKLTTQNPLIPCFAHRVPDIQHDASKYCKSQNSNMQHATCTEPIATPSALAQSQSTPLFMRCTRTKDGSDVIHVFPHPTRVKQGLSPRPHPDDLDIDQPLRHRLVPAPAELLMHHLIPPQNAVINQANKQDPVHRTWSNPQLDCATPALLS